MPFTFSHPALILPLTYLPKRYVSVTGLILGSMVPDLEKIARMKGISTYSHTWLSLLWYNLPLAILLSFVFHLLIRQPLIYNLPAFLQKRFYRYLHVNWPQHFKQHYGIVMFSVLVGAVSHLFWDGFTNKDGFFTDHISFLTNYTRVFGQATPHFILAHQLSSVIGGIIVLAAILKMPSEVTKNKVKPNPYPFKFWLTMVLVTGLIAFMRLLHNKSVWHDVIDLVLTTFFASLLGLVATCFFFRKQYINYNN